MPCFLCVDLLSSFSWITDPRNRLLQGDDAGLIGLIEDQCALPQPLLDLNFALRICSNRGKHRACVLLYTTLKMFDEALEAALLVL